MTKSQIRRQLRRSLVIAAALAATPAWAYDAIDGLARQAEQSQQRLDRRNEQNQERLYRQQELQQEHNYYRPDSGYGVDDDE
jgi:hypothetical protein